MCRANFKPGLEEVEVEAEAKAEVEVETRAKKVFSNARRIVFHNNERRDNYNKQSM